MSIDKNTTDISDKKLEANRANAQHSTGPKTEEGKAASSQNSRKHGLSAKTIFVAPERTEEFNALSDSLHAEVRPIGEIQRQYFEQMLHASWHTVIAREFLTYAYQERDDRSIVTFSRLLNQHERTFARVHKILQQLQTDMALRAIEENEPIVDLPLICEIKKITNEATKVAKTRPQTPPPGTEELTLVEQSPRWHVLARIGGAYRALAAITE
jgi:hypothetical protein